MTLDKKLAHLRKREGLSQADISEELDVSGRLYKMGNGVIRPSIRNLQSLSKLYNVPIEYLLDDSKWISCPLQEGRPWRGEQDKRKLWIGGLAIGAVVLAATGRLLFLVHSSQKNR